MSSFHFFNETLCRLKSWRVMSINDNGCIFLNVSCSFGCTMLDSETAKSTEINILSIIDKTIFDNLHETLNDYAHFCFSNTGLYCNLVDNICFSHNTSSSNILTINRLWCAKVQVFCVI